jgi:hypothetical protein
MVSINDLNLIVARAVGNVRAWEIAQGLKKTSEKNSNVDLAHGPRPNLPPKDPRYEMAVMQLRDSQSQVVPAI